MKREPKRKTNFFVSTTSTTYSDSYVKFDKINKPRYKRTHGRVKKGVDSVDGKRMLDSTCYGRPYILAIGARFT